nr:reverse transcriptase [Tanacetum cinerariifolium]
MIFHIDFVMKRSYSNDDTCFSIDVIDEILKEDFDALLDEGSEILHFIERTILEEKFFAEFDDKKPVVQKQRRLHPNMQEVVKKEIVKLVDTDIIYPITDGPWILLLQEFDIEIKDKKGTKNVAVHHLSRIDNDETSDDSDVDDNFLGENLMEITTNDTPWFVYFANYMVGDIIPKGMTYEQKNKFFSDLKTYFWEVPAFSKQKILRFVKILHFATKDLAFCQDPAFCYKRSYDTLSSCSNSEAQQMQQIQDKAKKSCMVSFRQLYSHLKRLSQNDLQGSRKESGFKRAFATLSGQDTETFTGTMFLNVEQLEKQLDKEDFQEIGSMFAFNVNERQMRTTKEKVDTCKALDASSVDTKSSKTESKEHDTSSRSGNDAHDDVEDIRPIYNEEPMAEIVGLRWVPTGKIFASSTTKVDSEPLIGSNADITNQYECKQTLDVSACTLNLSADADVLSQQELDLLFCPLYDEFFNADDEFTNPFCAPAQEEAESSSHNIGNSNVPTFNQPHVSEYRWTKDHSLEQVHGNPSKPVQTIRQLATDPEIYAYHARCIDSRKSTFGEIQFLGDKLVSWMSKKQNCTAMSSIEAETEYQLADMFTKALPEDMFKYLVRRIGMRCLTPVELEVLAKESA